MTDILVIGATGQLGRCLKDTAPGLNQRVNINYLSRDQLDLTSSPKIRTCIEKFKPDFILNAAAYTAVDKAEEQGETAYLVNRDAVKYIAEAAHNFSAKFIHISTDFVFDGSSSTPYSPDAPTNPLGVYGKSKLAGEIELRKTLVDAGMIIRTAWVYSEYGNNFVKTMLRLMQEKPSINVVNDQVGSPTYARGLATTIWSILDKGIFEPGIYHWTDRGEVSWYEFATAIQEEALVLGLLDKAIPINPISTAQYPTPAARPGYSVLDCSKLQTLINNKGTDWRKNLQEMLVQYSRITP